jgi:hypothetical protein
VTHLALEPHDTQRQRWPRQGRHVLAQFDDETIVVYQAYRPSIGRFAADHGHFGGDFSLSRMSWIKPNYLWMMYRSGWGTKEGQEVVLAVWLRRTAFDAILAQAVPSTQDTARFPARADWQRAVASSDVRLQWDPDHGPAGNPLERRAVQLGLRRSVLASYARPWIVRIEDVSPLVAAGREQLRRGEPLLTPREDVYPVDAAGRAALGM